MKSNISLLLLSAILFCNPAAGQAPDIEWQKALGGSNFDGAHSIQQTGDGGYIVAGQTNSEDGDVTSNHGGGDGWVVKLDAGANIVWEKSIGGSGLDVFRAIRQTSDGGYIAAGFTNSNNGDISGNRGKFDFLVVKLDVDGDITWQKCFGGSEDEEAYSVQQTADGGYIVAGSAESYGGDVNGNHGRSDYWIVKLDQDGNITWKKCLGGNRSELAFSIHQTADRGYIVAGQSDSNNGNVSGNHGGYDFWVVKLDDSGNITWQKSLGGSEDEHAFSCYPTTDGGYIVAGLGESTDGDVSGNHGDHDYWVVKLDDSGEIDWTKSLGGSGYDRPLFVSQTTDGGYLVAGDSDSNDGDINGNLGLRDTWLVKLNTYGNIVWQKKLGGSSNEAAYSVPQTTDGGYIVAGYTYSNDGDVGGGHGDADFWIVKLGPDDPLPVRLISFTAEKQENIALLQWKTVGEQDNHGFEIEHSIDAREWKQIGFQASRVESGNSNLTLAYIHTHPNPMPGRNYYRLKQIDFDGQYEYSPIRVITFDRPLVINVYPNPTAETVRITGLQGGETIRITDASGRVLKALKTGDVHASLSLDGFSDGMYHLHIIPTGGEAKTFKVVKGGKQ